MYITDATHFLDAKGAIGPQRGPGRKLAEFLGGVIVASTCQRPATPQPSCMKCRGTISAAVAPTDEIEWQCSTCPEAGRISNWRQTLWDMSTKNNEQHS
jgi:hypothetical protein